MMNNLTNFYHDLSAKIQNKNILFIHIPKTGGMAIKNSKFYKDKVYAYTHQGSLTQDYKNHNFTEIFTIVRNPYSRLVSAFFFLKKGGMHNYNDLISQKLLEPYDTFDSFVKHLKKEPEFIHKFIHLEPQVDFIYDDNTGLLVDDVLYTESLEEDYFILCDKYSDNCGELLEENTSKHSDYTSYYTKELQDIVYNLYKDDFVKLGYSYNLNKRQSKNKK